MLLFCPRLCSLCVVLENCFVAAAAAAAVNPFLDESMAAQGQFYGATGMIIRFYGAAGMIMRFYGAAGMIIRFYGAAGMILRFYGAAGMMILKILRSAGMILRYYGATEIISTRLQV
jgi:hypothetical protein